MFSCEKKRNEVFTFPSRHSITVTSKIPIDTEILQLNKVTSKHWKQLKSLQGRWAVNYLKWRYCSGNSHLLLAYAEGALVHVEWIVPSKNMKPRYLFLPHDSYSIISCLTSPKFRGLGIYPSQLRRAVESEISANTFWIWTASTNIPSLKGIYRAGGVKVAELVQYKWFWGCISHIKYFPLEKVS